MRIYRASKSNYSWKNITLFAVLGVVAFLTLSRAPRFEGRSQPHRIEHQTFQNSEPVHDARQVSPVLLQEPLKLLLATHNRLLWYFPDSGEQRIVHEGQGVYYGTFPGETLPDGTTSIWVVSRPHNWHPQSTTERLLHINPNTGDVLKTVLIPSRFSHDAIRYGNTVWVCNTGEGKLLQLNYPSMDVARSLDLFTVKEHINTVAAFDASSVWVVLHNLGNSAVVEVDRASGQVKRKFEDVGVNSHGLVMWRGMFVMLSSKEAALIKLNPATQEVTYIWKGDSGFLKGLAVIDNVAYFGASPPMERQARDGLTVQCDVLAVDLFSNKLLSRHKVHTQGLLNVVSAPHLSEASTYVAQQTPGSEDKHVLPLLQAPDVLRQPTLDSVTDAKEGSKEEAMAVKGHSQVQDQVHHEWQSIMQGPAAATVSPAIRWSESWLEMPLDSHAAQGQWPESNMPRMSLEVKLTTLENSAILNHHGIAPADIPSHLHLGKVATDLIQPVKEHLAEMPPEWWHPDEQSKVSARIADRDDNLQKVKPGVNTMFLIFSTRSADRIWELPLYKYFQPALDPLLHALIGERNMQNIVRLQLAQMTPGAHIKPHRDTGPWAQKTHRIHVVLKTNPEVSFFSCPECMSSQDSGRDARCQPPPHGRCQGVDAAVDNVFEINNLMIHEVLNTASEDRVHLVADVAEEPAPSRVLLQPGQSCHYVSTANQPNNPGC